MSVPVVASSSSNTLGSGTSLAITKPSGLASGDLLVAFVVANGTPTLGTPAGWTAIGSQVTDGFSACRAHRWWKKADSTDAAATDFTFTRSTSGSMAGGILRITGFDDVSASPVNVTATGSATSGTSQTSPAVTTTVADCLILRAMGTDSNTTTITTAGVTDVWNVAQTNARHALGTEPQASAGSTGTETWTFNTGNQMVATTVAIAPGSGGGASAPIITSDGGGSTATKFVDEGNTAVTTVVASGIPAPTYSITGGANSSSYSINSSSGALTRNTAIAYGAPEVVEVTATNTGGTDVQTITVVPNPMYSGAVPSAPLDDAAYFYRPTATFNASNTQYPNLGTRDEPLVLGADYTADGRDATWGTDGSGGHLVYVKANDTASHAAAPVAIVDCASFTVACRITWTDSSTLSTLFHCMKNVSLDEKNIFLHRQSDSTYEGRVWDGTTDSQVPAVGTSFAVNGDTDNVVLTYDGTTRVLTLYVNAAAEGTNTSPHARRLRGTDYYLEWPVSIGLADPTLCPNCKYRRMAFWTRALSSTEVTALETHTLWTTDNAESNNVTATPSTASLSLTTFAPTVSTPVVCTPGTANLSLTPLEPTVLTPVVCTPATVALVLQTFAPVFTTPNVVVPPTAELVITTLPPVVSATSHQTITPGTANLTITTYPPFVGEAPEVAGPASITGRLIPLAQISGELFLP